MNESQRILSLVEAMSYNFTESDWKIVGLETHCRDIINSHPRLLRSLSWGDSDYKGCVVDVVSDIAKRNPGNIEIMERYVLSSDNNTKGGLCDASLLNSCLCSPEVFTIPHEGQESRLLSLMMPFDAKFNPIADAIKAVASRLSLCCLRVDDLWVNSAIIQDIFSLIYRSEIVVCDFSGRNANVFYEAGIAHTLGRKLIPIVQNEEDIPFDLRHHRHIIYLANE